MTNAPRLRPDDPVDLHMHTFASDGRWTPEQLVDHLAGAGFRVVALADHDTMHNVLPMWELAATRGLGFVPAVEMTTRWRNRQLHVLIYGVDPRAETAAPFRAVLDKQRDQLTASAENAHRLLTKHGRFIPTLAEVAMGLPLRPHHVFTAMIRHGHGSNLYQAHRIVQGLGEPALVDVPVEETVAAAHASGGLAIVAHPGRDDGWGVLYEKDLDELLAQVPIDGVEAHYRSYKDADVERYRAWADANGLLVSAGSDSHWPNHPVNPIPHAARWIAPLLGRLGYPVDAWEGPAWTPAPTEQPVATATPTTVDA